VKFHKVTADTAELPMQLRPQYLCRRLACVLSFT